MSNNVTKSVTYIKSNLQLVVRVEDISVLRVVLHILLQQSLLLLVDVSVNQNLLSTLVALKLACRLLSLASLLRFGRIKFLLRSHDQ